MHGNVSWDFTNSTTDLTCIQCCHQNCSFMMFSWGQAQGSNTTFHLTLERNYITFYKDQMQQQSRRKTWSTGIFSELLFPNRMIIQGKHLPSQLADLRWAVHQALVWKESKQALIKKDHSLELRNDVAPVHIDQGVTLVLLTPRQFRSRDMTPFKLDM